MDRKKVYKGELDPVSIGLTMLMREEEFRQMRREER